MTDPGKRSLMETTKDVAQEFDKDAGDVRKTPTVAALEALRIAYLGRRGKVNTLMEELRACSKEEKPLAGKAINSLKNSIESTVNELKGSVAAWTIEKSLSAPPLDISLPVGGKHPGGSLHPVSLMRRIMLREFHRLGFTVYDGPDVDYDFFNFSALNFPDDHPARDMQDTFFIKGQDDLLLRTHTSNVQIHAMLNEKPPLRIVAPGRTFRCDSDPTHTPMFHQIEAFMVDRDISVAHMKAVIDTFLNAIFGTNMKTRFRPSFFPFVEPGAEVDMQCVLCLGKGCRVCKQTGWLELGGCGMIHPNVFEAVGYDSEAYTGFAFGFGIDRIAMLKYRLSDLRQLFEGDHAFLGQFPVYP
jgi:phenylalanyl-tRNA synthetase alpha chain